MRQGEDQWERIWSECANIHATSFRFKNKEKPFNYATSVANKLQTLPPVDVLCAGYVASQSVYVLFYLDM